ncbi:MAG: hypothetical protein ABSC06_39835 [Rhodopila sp.]
MRREVLRRDIDPAGAVDALDGLADDGDGRGLAPAQAARWWSFRVITASKGAAIMRRDGLASGQRCPA